MPTQNPLSRGAEAVYQQLRHQILDGQIASGSVLQQVELAERLGVSRTPVRHALQQLMHDGLVESLPGQTARVVSPSLQDALEMRQIRMWLEVPALLLALRRNPKPDNLLIIFDQISNLGETPTPQTCEELVRLDEQFHRWLLRESGNRNLEIIVGRLLDLLFRGTPFNIAQDYQSIRTNLLSLGDAIRSGDIQRVRQIMIEHMTDIGTVTVEQLIDFEGVST